MTDSDSHPFSPIISEENLHMALDYIAEKSLLLARAVLETELPIDTICFFTHSQEEYDFLLAKIMERGKLSKLSHGTTTYADTNFFIKGQRIEIFGVRQPDPSRPEVGYGDYPVDDYQHFLELAGNNPYMHEITSGLGKSLIELRHPSLDVLGFIVDKKDH